jgi:hypothetical protein
MSDALKMQNRLAAFALEESLPIGAIFDLDIPLLNKAADDGMASTTTADAKVWSNPFDFPLQLVDLNYNATGGGITANDTNYAQIQAKTTDGVSATPALGMQLETKITGGTGNIADGVGVTTTTKQSGGGVVGVGGSLFVGIAKQGSGVIVRAGMVTARLRRI